MPLAIMQREWSRLPQALLRAAFYSAALVQHFPDRFTRSGSKTSNTGGPTSEFNTIQSALRRDCGCCSESSLDFAASDMPLSGEELSKAGGLRQLATVLGAVVPIYNVEGAPDGLNLTGEVLVGIYSGTIVRWNDPAIRAVNPGVRLPDSAITVIHRSDGSGTTFVFTDYLSKVSPEWKTKVGSGTTVAWPTGAGAERNEGVAELVNKTRDSIGYVEFIYALQHELKFGAVRNVSGAFVKADIDSVTSAAKSVTLPAGSDFRFSITNAPGKHTYPISSFTWLVLPAELKDKQKQSAMLDLLRWILTTGQKECNSLGYPPLPAELAAQELRSLPQSK